MNDLPNGGTMSNYWDYTKAERSLLTEAQVQACVDYELMTQGVVRPAPPLVREVVRPELPKHDVIQITRGTKYGGFEATCLAFATADQAEKFLALSPLWVDSEYLSPGTMEFVGPLNNGALQPIKLARRDDVLTAREALTKAAEAEASNRREREEFEKNSKAVKEAAESLWSDWHEQVAQRRSYERIKEVLADYERTAGNLETAMRFLEKAFSVEDIAAAKEWVGLS